MYSHILLAADGSENALRAAHEAIKFSRVSPETLIEIAYVADFDKARQDYLHAASPEALTLERRRKLAPIEQLCKQNGAQYKVTILKGIPGPELIRYANEQQVDLVIIGSRGLNSLQEMILGSVSHKVVKRGKCPALIVK